MTQTLAIFLDAYRDLNSRKLFWLAIILSGLVVLVVAALGVNERGFTIVGYTVENPVINSMFLPPSTFYKTLFVFLGVNMWLAWLSTILALVSTASMVPELVASGSIDMMLSKPISRARLFLTRWSTGLLFTAIQAVTFTLASFLVIGVRGGVWEPSLFLAVPVLVIFYSYLFSVCALVGLVTRSTIASLIIVLIFWVLVWVLQKGESLANTACIFHDLEIQAVERVRAQRLERNPDADVDKLNEQLERDHARLDVWQTIHTPFYYVVTCLPKTQQTTDWLARTLVSEARLGRQREDDEPLREMFQSEYVKTGVFRKAMQDDAEQNRGVWWSIGTSLIFEAVVLGACVLYFKRRDF